jgi:hypothetical protein
MNRPLRFPALLLLSVASCLAQSGPLPVNYKTILTNRPFRVISVHYGPHEKVPVHDHPDTPTVYVYLNDSGPVRIIHEEKDGSHSDLVRPPTHTGAFRVSPGLLERHSIENLSDLPSDFLRVELLGIRLGNKTLEFRGKAPADLSHDLTAAEFQSPELSVARTICTNPSPCSIAPSPMSSVLVAISGSIVTASGHQTMLQLGDVMPVAPGQSLQIAPTSTEPAHVLQILVQPPAAQAAH